MRGGWKGGGRPKKERPGNDPNARTDKTIGVRIPLGMYNTIMSLGVKLSDYIRKLIEADLKERNFLDDWNKGK